MKYIFALLLLLTAYTASYGNITDLELSDEVLTDLIMSCEAIESIDNVTPEQIDSVSAEYKNLKYIPASDLDQLYSFLVPQLIPSMDEHMAQFMKCEPYARKYLKNILPSVPVIVDKYQRGNEASLTENLGNYFHLFLFIGLAGQDKLDVLDKYILESITDENLEKVFIEAKGTEVDNLIYFVMANSTMPLFNLMVEKYDIPEYGMPTKAN